MKILKSTLPQWAQDELAKDDRRGYSSIGKDDGTLNIVGNYATFDGAEVVDVLDEPQQKTISIHDVPSSIKRIIITTKLGSTIQSNINGNILKIERNGTAIYNGQTVLNSTVIEEQ